MSGIEIGNGAVISANACVVKDVAPYSIVGGNPAKKIKNRFDSDIIQSLLDLKWWELPIEDIKEIQKILSQEPQENLLRSLIERYRRNI
jgi:virginiamycin A acetyltransferase